MHYQLDNYDYFNHTVVILTSDKFCQDATTGCGGKNIAKTSVSSD